ncbi:hypothetical protein EDC01DRAFT_635304 [Geopyxis carbonaria]|nr:hypothetical protein EDC01DRAFT_635304 [Geopyxis carbonaria]
MAISASVRGKRFPDPRPYPCTKPAMNAPSPPAQETIQEITDDQLRTLLLRELHKEDVPIFEECNIAAVIEEPIVNSQSNEYREEGSIPAEIQPIQDFHHRFTTQPEFDLPLEPEAPSIAPLFESELEPIPLIETSVPLLVGTVSRQENSQNDAMNTPEHPHNSHVQNGEFQFRDDSIAARPINDRPAQPAVVLERSQAANHSQNINSMIRKIEGTTEWECIICQNYRYKDKNGAQRHVSSKHFQGVPCPLAGGQPPCVPVSHMWKRSDHLQAHYKRSHANMPRELFRAAFLQLNRGYKSANSILKWIDQGNANPLNGRNAEQVVQNRSSTAIQQQQVVAQQQPLYESNPNQSYAQQYNEQAEMAPFFPQAEDQQSHVAVQEPVIHPFYPQAEDQQIHFAPQEPVIDPFYPQAEDQRFNVAPQELTIDPFYLHVEGQQNVNFAHQEVATDPYYPRVENPQYYEHEQQYMNQYFGNSEHGDWNQYNAEFQNTMNDCQIQPQCEIPGSQNENIPTMTDEEAREFLAQLPDLVGNGEHMI